MKKINNKAPDTVIACVGGGSNEVTYKNLKKNNVYIQIKQNKFKTLFNSIKQCICFLQLSLTDFLNQHAPSTAGAG